MKKLESLKSNKFSKLDKFKMSEIKGGSGGFADLKLDPTGAGEKCNTSGACMRWDKDTSSGAYFNLRVVDKPCN
jgi:natural product precursor